MTYPNLFKNIDYKNDRLWIVKEYFNKIHDSFFLHVINGIIANREGRGDEYAGCQFPEEVDYDEEPFEGIKCWYFEDEVIVSEDDFKKCLILACEEYARLNPEKKEEIKKITNQPLA